MDTEQIQEVYAFIIKSISGKQRNNRFYHFNLWVFDQLMIASQLKLQHKTHSYLKWNAD